MTGHIFGALILTAARQSDTASHCVEPARDCAARMLLACLGEALCVAAIFGTLACVQLR